MRWAAALAVVSATVAGAACGSPSPATTPTLRLAVTERSPLGAKLVLVDEHGDRWAVLGRGGLDDRDEQAAFSPDGRWIVFVSTRGRTDGGTSLWVMPAGAGATAVRLTDGTGVEVDPAWTADSRAVVFARRRDAWFELWQVAISVAGPGAAIGAPVQRSAGRGHRVAPSVSASGDIAYQEIDGGVSRIAILGRDGSTVFATDGPADATPAWRPRTETLAFARRTVAGGLDLWLVDGDGAARSLAVLPDTDDSGPRWSSDGRWLFATALSRDPDDDFAAVVYLDATDPAAPPRMLRDRVGAIPRQGPAPAPVPLDAQALAAGPDFTTAVTEARRERAREREREQERTQARARLADAGLDGAL